MTHPLTTTSIVATGSYPAVALLKWVARLRGWDLPDDVALALVGVLLPILHALGLAGRAALSRWAAGSTDPASQSLTEDQIHAHT